MDLYAENILDHYRHPRSKTALAQPTVRHEEINVSCGDQLTLDLSIENDRIASIGWQGEGCAISQAAMSMFSEELIGKTVDEAMAIEPKHIYDMLGVEVGPRRHKCALLCLHALKNALNIAQGKKLQSWTETVAEK